MKEPKQLSVSAIQNGTVIDHIPAKNLFKVITILGLDHIDTHLTFGTNLDSKKLGKKAIIKGLRGDREEGGGGSRYNRRDRQVHESQVHYQLRDRDNQIQGGFKEERCTEMPLLREDNQPGKSPDNLALPEPVV